MNPLLLDVEPKALPPLDPGFRPIALAHREFRRQVETSGDGVPLVIAVEREGGNVTRFETQIFPEGHPRVRANNAYVERLVKFLLWQWGGWKVCVAGPEEIGRFLTQCYSPTGPRAFDEAFWGGVYEKQFEIAGMPAVNAPAAVESKGAQIATNWSGWRIGFDLGASDRKVAVAKDGQLALRPDGSPILSEEFVWDPKPQTDANWHFVQIMEILKAAEAAIKEIDPTARIEAIGGSSAGVHVGSRVRIASLFRGIAGREEFERTVAPIYHRVQEAWGGIPFRLENDGDVSALAGALALDDGAVLGLAMGSSLAAGYVDDQRLIAGWMNELAFAPIDLNPEAPEDEWSGDRGVGANYMSQQAVGRLIPLAGIELPDVPEDALPERLLRVQQLMEAGDERARQIYLTIGCYFGYAVAQYCDFYPEVRHVEVLGRVVTGEGGKVILDEARGVFREEFPELLESIDFYEPDEREKRHGQAVAAASLPLIT